MKDKTDQELIEIAQRVENATKNCGPSFGESCIIELARRLKAANERLKTSARILPVQKREDFFCLPDSDFTGEPDND